MKGRWLIATFGIIFGLLCIRQLSYSWYTHKIENEAKNLAKNEADEKIILDSLAQDTVNYGVIKYNYLNAKENELHLGLDLKGGINVILEVSERDLIENLAANNQNPMLENALDNADKEHATNGNLPYVELFFQEFDKVKGATKYADPNLFGNKKNVGKIKFNSTDDDVKDFIRKDIEAKVSTAYDVISSRINKFGVVEPVIQRLGSKGDGRILVELAGVTDADRVKKLLQSTARLEFWKVERDNMAVLTFLQNIPLDKYKAGTGHATKATKLGDVLKISGAANAMFSANVVDTAIVNKVLSDKTLKASMPANIRNFKFYWANKTLKTKDANNGKFLGLYVLSGNSEGQPILTGDHITSATGERSAGSIANEPVVKMNMDQDGTREWANITDQLKPKGPNSYGDGVAIVLDDLVYSAPNVNDKITGGVSTITGDFTLEEAQDLANILNAGSLPASSKIVSAEVVGPSLGQEAINSSLLAFVAAFAIVLIWMLVYYSEAGIYANIALVINLLFLLGFLVSIHATLSLPGIAGIILTLVTGMDANIIIYERVKEELRLGKNIRTAVAYAYTPHGALSAIIDSYTTSFLTSLVLLVFGKGPVQGFATTFIIGLFTSAFTAIFVTHYFIDKKLSKGKDVKFYTDFTKNWLSNIHVDFLKTRKINYVISAVITVVCLVSIFTRGFDMGIEFEGGRTYIVRFDKSVDPTEVVSSLEKVYVLDGETYTPQVKVYGNDHQLKITTSYKAHEVSTKVDDEVRDKLYQGLKTYLPSNLDLKHFGEANSDTAIGVVSSSKVGPTIADDTTRASFIAVGIAILIMAVYLLSRFRKWQFSISTVFSLLHDVIVVLGCFSLFKGILPFPLEIDQAFIAAILTVIGYSLHDTIIILDRFRHYMEDHKNMPLYEVINQATSHTLSRTVNTSVSTFFVVLCILIFGGESIKGFMFAMLVGVVIGTYSSLFVASPLIYDLAGKDKKI